MARARGRFAGGGWWSGAGAGDLPGCIDGPVGDPAAPEARARTATTARRAFIEGSARTPAESAERIRKPSSPNILQAGSLIPAALITGIRSDLPGQVTAQVTQNVYDSQIGRAHV